MHLSSPILRKIGAYVPFSALVLAVAILSLRRIHLVTADLGRHISNGRALLTDSHVLDTNFYSYTFPDVSFVNHHWGSGVVFYGIHQWFGFDGLSYLHMAHGFQNTCT